VTCHNDTMKSFLMTTNYLMARI